MLKYSVPAHYATPVFVIPDEATAARYREWDGGYPEAKLIEWVKQRFSSQNGAFVDVGANCGLWTVNLARSFRRVYAFEPNLETFCRLAASVALSLVDPSRITLKNFALGAEGGFAKLRTTGSDAFDASIVQHGADVPGFDVEVERLSDVLFDTDVALVKIDVEGFEYEVLSGAERFLRAAGLPPILFESWVEKRGQRPFEDTKALLEGYGYEVNPVDWPEEYLATRRKA